MATSAQPTGARVLSVPTTVLRLRDGRWHRRRDELAGEEPLEIRVAPPGSRGRPVAVTMRTPGADFALAVGLLVTEGLIGPQDVRRVSYCTAPGEQQAFNVVLVRCATPLRADITPRAHPISAACGVCGTATLDGLRARCAPLDDAVRIPSRVLLALPARLAAAQPGFGRTGALHAAAVFAPDGTPLGTYEDIGRHNAVDKVVGAAALEGRLPLSGTVLVVSGRLSFEIVQKAAVAGIPVVCAVSGPSHLAVRTAHELGVTAIGFLRDDRMNVYTHPERVGDAG